MIYDVEMRWYRRWWFGFIPYWVLQYRKLTGRSNSGAHDMGSPHGVALTWSKWEDAKRGSEGIPEL